jgi:ribulose-5-phosphate 4-epimerase/fuculose-1-phosphate aldolase
MESHADIEHKLCHAAAKLAGKGLMLPGDTLAQRIPERQSVAAVTLRSRQDVPEDVVWSSLRASPETQYHRIFAARPDVGAVLAGQPAWASALAKRDLGIPAVFDEQIRHLGLEARRISGLPEGKALAALLSGGANAFMLDRQVLCFGMTLDRVVMNTELLEKCAKAYLLAISTGERIRRIPWIVRFIANGKLRQDEKEARVHHLRGERAVPRAGY